MLGSHGPSVLWLPGDPLKPSGSVVRPRDQAACVSGGVLWRRTQVTIVVLLSHGMSWFNDLDDLEDPSFRKPPYIYICIYIIYIYPITYNFLQHLLANAPLGIGILDNCWFCIIHIHFCHTDLSHLLLVLRVLEKQVSN